MIQDSHRTRGMLWSDSTMHLASELDTWAFGLVVRSLNSHIVGHLLNPCSWMVVEVLRSICSVFGAS